MANNSFSTNGATPYAQPKTSPFSLGSPQSRALAGAQSPNMSTPLGQKYAPPPVAPTANVASHTTIAPTGEQVKVTYHKPETGMISPTGSSAGTASTPTNTAQAKPDTSGIYQGLLGVQDKLSTLQEQQKAPYSPSNPGMFGNIVSNLATPQVDPQTTEGYLKYNQAVQGLSDFEKEANKRLTGVYEAPASATVMSSRENAIQNANASTRAQLQAAVGQQQQAIGFGQAQQGLTQAGQTAAAELAQPSANFPFVFNPTTGQFSAPGTGGGGASGGGVSLTYNPQTDSQSLAKAVMNHQISYDDAIKALSYGSNSSNAPGQLSAAILAAGGNVSQLQAQNTVQGEQNVQVEQWTSALQQAKNLQSQLSDLISTFGLNPNDINAANIGLQQIAANSSDPRYQALNSYLTDIASVYSNILTPPGGTQTDTTRSLAMGLLDGTAKGQSIINQMQVLDNQAQAKISGVHTVQGNTSETSGGNGEFSVQASDGNHYGFKFQNGKWVYVGQ